MTSLKVPTIERLSGSAAHLSASPAQRLKSFSADQSGNIGVIFGLTLMVTASVVGGAIDYGRAINARHQTQKALDAASLAGGRILQVGGTAAAAVAAADQVYAAQKSKFTLEDNIKFVPPTGINTSIDATGGVTVATPFLSLVGIEKLAAIPDAATVSGSCVGPTCGASGTGNTGTNIEISMMLDTTGSMCDKIGDQYQQPCNSGEKLNALKAAAKDLIDIVVWKDQSKFTSRVAIAPFANTVNVGKYFHAVTNEGVAGDTATHFPIVGYTSYSYPSSCYRDGRLRDSCRNNSQYGVGPIYGTVAQPAAPCVVERIGENEFTDVSPAGLKRAPQAGQQLTSAIVAANNPTMVPWNKATSTCGESTPIQPLTSNKTALKTAIDGMIGKNGTAGALGTAWAWHLISPEWANIFTGDAKPASYSNLTELDEAGKPKLRKIVILMTDGVYNTHQQGVGETAIETKAKALCTAMKNKGIQVYTIGFALGSDQSAINTLTDCASSHTIDTTTTVKSFYNAATPTALQAAFRDIALQISTLRLTR